MIRFCVSDTGIAPDALDRIFEPFIQLDCSLARRPVGTGLGLALVRRLAEIHGGSVECTSTPGRGSTFVVRLPQGLPGPAAAATPTQSPPTRPTRTDGEVRPSVVIVDEHEVNLTLLSRWFPPRDRRVAVARDGGRPSSGMRAMFADVVRMDAQMPTMGGFAAIRADQEIADISIIAVTALAMPGDH